MRVPDGILERPAAVVRLFRGAALDAVLDAFDAVEVPGRKLGDETTAKAVLLHQMAGNQPELGREILMDEQNVHGISQEEQPYNVGQAF